MEESIVLLAGKFKEMMASGRE